MQTKTYSIDMCNGPIFGKMLKFAVPLICSNILQILFNAADIVVVGKFAGDASLAAVGSNSPLINLITNLFIGLSVGANMVVSRHIGASNIGAKDSGGTSKAVHTAITMGFFSGLFLTVVGVLGAPLFLTLMKTPAEVLPKAVLYLRIYFCGMTSVMLYNFGSAVLRSVGDTKRPLYYLLFAGVLNVVLNVFFVVSCNMDVAGVAFATIISQTVSAFLVLRCLFREKSDIRLRFKLLRIDVNKFIQILQLGLPAGFQGIVFALSNTVIQSSINGFGAFVMAGNAAASNIEGIAYFAMNAFYQATISFTSQNYGAGNIKRINRIVLIAESCVIVTGIFVGFTILAFGTHVLGVFSSNPQVIEAGMNRLRIILRTYFLCGMMDVTVGALRGLGYSFLSMIVSLVGACALRLLWLATVFTIPVFHTTQTVYASYPVTWFITFAVNVVCYVIVKKKVNRRFTAG